jgi:hypothetical protein
MLISTLMPREGLEYEVLLTGRDLAFASPFFDRICSSLEMKGEMSRLFR